jgi:hypothetical protein
LKSTNGRPGTSSGTPDGGSATVTRAVAVAPAPVVQVQDQTPAPPAVTPPAVAPPAVTPPSALGTLSVALPGGAPVPVLTRTHVAVSCTIASARASTCSADLFATDPAKASAASAVRGRLLGRGSARIPANHKGAVKVTIALNATGRSLAARHPRGFPAALRLMAHYAGTKRTSRVTRQVRVKGI